MFLPQLMRTSERGKSGRVCSLHRMTGPAGIMVGQSHAEGSRHAESRVAAEQTHSELL